MLAAAAAWPLLPDHGVVCPLRRFTGVPCPLCGMTTGVVRTVHGRVADAFAANPAAPLLVLLVVAAWVAVLLARAGGPRLRAPSASTLYRVAIVAVPAMWAYQLVRFDVV